MSKPETLPEEFPNSTKQLNHCEANPNDGNMTSVLDVNEMIAQKLFVLDKADKLIKAEVVNKPDSVFNKYV